MQRQFMSPLIIICLFGERIFWSASSPGARQASREAYSKIIVRIAAQILSEVKMFIARGDVVGT